jgi:hypothetical protein
MNASGLNHHLPLFAEAQGGAPGQLQSSAETKVGNAGSIKTGRSTRASFPLPTAPGITRERTHDR